MSQIISLSLCLSDIDKSKITAAKNGKLYLNLTVGTSDESDQYGESYFPSFPPFPSLPPSSLKQPAKHVSQTSN